MKVLIIARNLTKMFSAPHYAAKLANNLAKKSVRVLIATSNPQIHMDNVGIIKLPKFFGRRTFSPILYSIFAKYAKGAYEIDIVHGHGYTFRDDVTTVHFLRRGLRYYAKMMGYDVPQSYIEPFEELLLRSSRHLIVPSNMIKECLVKLYGIENEYISVVHHGVDIDEFTVPSPKEKARARKTLGLHEEFIYIGFVGPPRWKGLEFLLRALAKLPIETYLLAVNVSNTDYYIRLSERLGVKKRVKMSPSLMNLSLFYKAIDIFTLSTIFDSFSLTTLEAMSSGLPVIVSSNAGVSELIKDGEGFVLADPRDVNSLAEVLDMLIKDEELRKTVGLNARKAAEKLSWDNVATKTLEVYESLLRR